jgi:hypothetical protein
MAFVGCILSSTQNVVKSQGDNEKKTLGKSARRARKDQGEQYERSKRDSLTFVPSPARERERLDIRHHRVGPLLGEQAFPGIRIFNENRTDRAIFGGL